MPVREKKPEALLTVIQIINTVKLHLSGLIGTASHPDLQKIRIIGFFFENGLNLQFEVGNKFQQTSILGYIFVHVQIKH
jgi:hypothetical protein